MTKNEKFYTDILKYEKEGKILYSVQASNIPDKFFRIKIGQRYFCLHIDIVDFAKEIEDMVETSNLFTQNMLEKELHCSNTKIGSLVQKGEYEIITRGTKLYIKKDW